MDARRNLATVAAFATALSLAACAAIPPEPAATSTPPGGDGPVVAFYGDSYTLGTGASSDGARWSTIISADRGWREVNPSVNGLGFINNRSVFGEGDLPSIIIAAEPDLVFVTMGLNDNFTYERRPDERDRIREQIGIDLERLRDGLPEARIVVVEPFWYTDERPDSVEVIIGWVREGAEAIDAEFIAGASRWIEGRPELMAADGLHPNDDGYAVMAERMDEALAELGL
ncbi:SGNH/GDSL hydrolase family protein [Microcella sp.]|uniref:SGNH/GDSL hydrolase family protein n=1 Tax=Microcella sp. TaxID=1913979 RepID=UPI00391C59E0